VAGRAAREIERLRDLLAGHEVENGRLMGLLRDRPLATPPVQLPASPALVLLLAPESGETLEAAALRLRLALARAEGALGGGR
jgi:hypothetical protein